jgi:hypothetical protein
VNVDRHVQLFGGRDGFLQQGRLAGFRLCRIENALDAAVVGAAMFFDEFNRSLQSGTPSVLSLFIIMSSLSVGEMSVLRYGGLKKTRPPS